MGNLNFDFDVDRGEETITLTVEVDYRVECDPDYGADADGNRGMPSWFLDDMSFKIFAANGNDITELIKTNKPSVYKEIEDKAEDMALDEGMNQDGNF